MLLGATLFFDQVQVISLIDFIEIYVDSWYFGGLLRGCSLFVHFWFVFVLHPLLLLSFALEVQLAGQWVPLCLLQFSLYCRLIIQTEHMFICDLLIALLAIVATPLGRFLC